ncbi:MAG TPA: helicase-associated domain-containing protein [Ktedonobacteraceae bacterium]
MANMTAPLRKALQARSAEDLTRIEQSWATDNVMAESWSSTGKSVNGRGMLDIISARFAWAALSLNAREILHQMITFQVTGGVPRADLQALSGLGKAEFVGALAELEQSIMLIEVRPDAKVRQRLEEHSQQTGQVLAIPKDFHDMFLVIHQEIYGRGSDRSQMHLPELLSRLDSYKLQLIQTLSTTSANPYDYYRHTFTPAALAGRLMQMNAIEAIWEKLDATEQQICRRLCRADGSSAVTEIQEALHLSRSMTSHYVNQLENYGLSFSTFSGHEFKLFIARDIFKVVRKFINELDKLEERVRQGASLSSEMETAPAFVVETHSQLLADLAVVINSVYQMVIEPTQAGYVPKRLANKIAPLLHGSRENSYDETDYYLEMVFSLARSLGLVYPQQSFTQKPRYMPAPNLAKWTRQETVEQVSSLLRLWREVGDRNWSDVTGVGFYSSGFGYYYMDSRAAREGLISYMAEHCQPGKWYALQPFLQNIKANKPLLLHEHSRYANYGGSRNSKTILSNWDSADGEVIVGMFASSLHEMGLVTLGFQSNPAAAEEPGNPDAFQFTELGAQVLWGHATKDHQAGSNEHARTLIVQPNFELLLLQPDYQTLYKLLPFSKVNQVEMVSRLTLTQESVRRGVEAGFGVERVISVLQECSQKELPQNVLYTLQDWGRLYKNATISQVLMIEVSSEAVADEICASPKLRALELRRLGPCAVAIGGQVSLQVLRTTLEKEGLILNVQGEIVTSREAATATSDYGRRR